MKTRNPFVAVFLLIGIVPLHADTISVTSVNDSGPGSLRAALAGAASGDTINFSLTMPATITLTSGELLVTKSVTIAGSGPVNLAVDGNATNRVFHIGSNTVVYISGLTISNGNATGAYPANSGGAIYNDHATLTVSNCTLSHNRAALGSGICNLASLSGSATVEVVNSALSSNGPAIAGGGIYNYADTNGSASVKVVTSVLNGNSASVSGGGIFNDAEGGGSASVQVANSTVSGNVGGSVGNGISNQSGSGGTAILEIVNSTFSGNRGGDSDIFIDGFGGSATLEIGGTILDAGGSGSNIRNYGTVISLGYNLSSDGGGGFLTATGDRINTDPMLGPLQDNGGPTFTHALMVGSPAVDQAKDFSGLATDQRGAGFERTHDDPNVPNATGGDGTDIGAYEAQQLRMTAAVKAGYDLQFSFTSLLGTNYEVQSRADMVAGMWTSLQSGIPGNGGIAVTTVTNAFTQSQQFYRIHPVP